MEGVVIDRDFWRGRRVFLTGHTGFKGAWATLLLAAMGAEVHGYALPPEDENALFNVAQVERDVQHGIGDLRDAAAVRRAVEDARPDIVIHMAAQPLVRLSYAAPVDTYATNIMGTVHLLEAIRHVPGIKAVVVVTSDKCYDNTGSLWGYRETDHLGGHDPYSNSKACTEIVTDGYRRSFFSGESAPKIASGRAGNVIGGGDWARDRLVPDAVRAFLAKDVLRIRNPAAVRPWQHVLDPVAAYLVLAQRLVTGGAVFAEGWNFGPSAASEVPVEHIVGELVRLWGAGARWSRDTGSHPHEAAYLRLDCAKAQARLGWKPLIPIDQALALTVHWYRAFDAGENMRAVTVAQIESVFGSRIFKAAA